MEQNSTASSGLKEKIKQLFRTLLKHIRYDFSRLTNATEERKEKIVQEISAGSKPHTLYFIMMLMSVEVAAIGLVSNSAAVIIGAMLISPLMTPIFGMAMGMVVGDYTLIKKAFVSELAGIILAIVAAMLFGAMPFTTVGLTEEILARTSPTLLDLGIATFAGVSGCLALIDEKVGSALPGVAMATALTPPLAVCGLALSMGSFEGALGALLLFIANLLAIFMVAILIFYFTGFVPRAEMREKWGQLRKPVVITTLSLFVVSMFLGHTLVSLHKNISIEKQIRATLAEFSKSNHGLSISDLDFVHRSNRVSVLVEARTAKEISPTVVSQLEEAIEAVVGVPADLVMRYYLSVDVSSQGKVADEVREDLAKAMPEVDPLVLRQQLAEQLIREIFDAKYPVFTFEGMEIAIVDGVTVCFIKVNGYRELFKAEVAKLQVELRQRLVDETLKIFVNCRISHLVGAAGKTNYPLAHLQKLSAEAKVIQDKLDVDVKDLLGYLNCEILGVDIFERNGRWVVMAEVVLATQLNSAQMEAIDRKLTQTAGKTAQLVLVNSGEYYRSANKFISRDEALEVLYGKSSPVLNYQRPEQGALKHQQPAQ